MDKEYDIDRIADVIRESGADIVGLQEVDVHWDTRSNFDDTIALLAEKLDMFYFFAPIYDMEPYNPGEPNRQFGVGILSKYPIISAENREISRLSTQDPDPTPKPAPGFAEVIINVKGIHIPIYSTHLDYRGDPTVRKMQVAEMLEIMEEHPGQKILFGDMNAKPNAPELQPLFNYLNDVFNDGKKHNTFPSDKPDRRIDYILPSEEIKVEYYETIKTQASDHLPIVADLILNKGNKTNK